MVWCVEFQHTADATARSKKASQCGPGPAALPPSRLSTPPPWPATCGTVSSKASTGAFAACDPAAGLGVPVNKHRLHLGARQLQADIGELGPHCIRGCLQLQNDASAARHGA
ncbi:uncharacterized protein LOC144140024 isoform X1 [Haemaphysalis longicornis]